MVPLDLVLPLRQPVSQLGLGRGLLTVYCGGGGYHFRSGLQDTYAGPSYYVFGGLVFTPLAQPYLHEFAGQQVSFVEQLLL